MALLPLTFVSNAFVPSDELPGPMRVIAEWNPVSTVVAACRELFGNIPPGWPEPDAWPLQHPVAASFLWVAVILLVFVPLAIRRYQRAVSQ
ncbi:ABC transporter permease [Streptomyces salinarius]|nr:MULTISPECIES: ABC transporter permease [unclassified Streptomyces]